MEIARLSNASVLSQHEQPFVHLQENVVRLRDVEMLTSLQLLTSASDEQERILLLTHSEVGLWPRMSWLDLADDDVITNEPICPQG